MPCLSRITSDAHKLPFEDGKHYFYMESVCGNGCEGTICPKCSTKKEKALQISRTFDHGLVTEPYKEKSHIYDSPWYHKFVERYGVPSEESIKKAKEAQVRAKQGVPVQVQKPTEDVNKKPKKLQRPKPAITKAPIATSIPNTEDTLVETMDEPLMVKEVVEIVLRPKMIQSTMYWYDDVRGKLYKHLGETSRGVYVGRWNAETQSICLEAPDSDDDDSA